MLVRLRTDSVSRRAIWVISYNVDYNGTKPMQDCKHRQTGGRHCVTLCWTWCIMELFKFTSHKSDFRNF